MSIIRQDLFDERYSDWVNDPNVPDEEKQELLEMGLGGPFSEAEAIEINELCFSCGKHLSFPYVYWHGFHGDIKGESKGISLHADCAKHLARGITRDALEIESEKAK